MFLDYGRNNGIGLTALMFLEGTVLYCDIVKNYLSSKWEEEDETWNEVLNSEDSFPLEFLWNLEDPEW